MSVPGVENKILDKVNIVSLLIVNSILKHAYLNWVQPWHQNAADLTTAYKYISMYLKFTKLKFNDCINHTT